MARRKKAAAATDLGHGDRAANLPITMRIDGRDVKVSVEDAMSITLWQKACAGDHNAMKLVIALEREREPPLPRTAESDGIKRGYLVMYEPLRDDEEWELLATRVRVQPTLPILERFRKELGMPPTPGYVPPPEDDDSS